VNAEKTKYMCMCHQEGLKEDCCMEYYNSYITSTHWVEISVVIAQVKWTVP
jgi:hypothetical protein